MVLLTTSLVLSVAQVRFWVSLLPSLSTLYFALHRMRSVSPVFQAIEPSPFHGPAIPSKSPVAVALSGSPKQASSSGGQAVPANGRDAPVHSKSHLLLSHVSPRLHDATTAAPEDLRAAPVDHRYLRIKVAAGRISSRMDTAENSARTIALSLTIRQPGDGTA